MSKNRCFCFAGKKQNEILETRNSQSLISILHHLEAQKCEWGPFTALLY